MNKDLLKKYIEEYKRNFENIHRKEIYKWKAVKCYQDNWDLNAVDFHDMLVRSLSQTGNLLRSGQFFPLRMLEHYSRLAPIELRGLYVSLFDENEDIFVRIKQFQNGMEELNNKFFPGKSTYQDLRAVIVSLALQYPDRYFFYKHNMFLRMSERLELSYRPIRGRLENIGHFNTYCKMIKHELLKDHDLIKMHRKRLDYDCYDDLNLNVLTQDFIYAISRHLDLQQSERLIPDFPQAEQMPIKRLVHQDEVLGFQGVHKNFLENSIENKRIGDLGELWVMEFEREKLRRVNLHKLVSKVKHVSKDLGDGVGYDIRSYDEKGKEIFIEVKTTKGARDSSFYITQTELRRSNVDEEKFRLYRVYNFNEDFKTAELFVVNGDLSELCTVPVSYRVNLSRID